MPKIKAERGEISTMSDAQWTMVLHITLLVLQALVTVIQGILALYMKQVRAEVRAMLRGE